MRSFYHRYLLPHIVHLCCSNRPASRQRAKLVPRAQGEVLEVGFGSGLNLPFYDAGRVQHLWALEPSGGMNAKSAGVLQMATLDVDLLAAPAESIPLDDNSIDSVVMTYTLCTLPAVPEAMAEIRRVLRPSGLLLFCEHGAAPDASVRRWQKRANPVWRAIGGGCHLDRAIPDLIEAGGFDVKELDTLYLPGWKPATFNYLGSASPR